MIKEVLNITCEWLHPYFLNFFLNMFKTIYQNLKVNEDGPSVFIRQHQASISGNYLVSSMVNKVHMDVPAYMLMYQSFKRSNQLTKEINDFFSGFFYRAIRQMKPVNIDYIKTLYFTWLNGLLPSDKKVFRLFIYRILGIC